MARELHQLIAVSINPEATMLTSPRILVLGVGNILWADEGFGVRAVEELDRRYRFPSNVRLLDGGTQGLYLLAHVRESDVLVVFDAIDYGLAPGKLRIIEGDAVPRYLGARKVSLHQTGFQEVLATAAMLGDYPEQLFLIGVQPECIDDYGGSLTAVVRSRIEPAMERALSCLARFGVEALRREESPRGVTAGKADAIGIAGYESGRPAADLACRHGDERVLASDRFVLTPKRWSRGDAVTVDVDQRSYR